MLSELQFWGGLAFLAVIILGIMVKSWQRRMLDRSMEYAQKGITADQLGNPAVEKTILAQSVELHIAAPIEHVVGILAQVKFPFMYDRIGDREWADRPALADAKSWGRLEPVEGGTRARMLWGQDSGGMAPTSSDWTKLRTRLAAAATTAGITVTEHQGPRMNRVPLGDVSHLSAADANRAQHRWQAVDI